MFISIVDYVLSMFCLFFLLCLIFFFFKQKTAYEMRISDWSSDVCSSDLTKLFHQPTRGFHTFPALGRVCLRLIVLRRFTMTTSNEKSYFDLHITGLGYLNRIREVKPKKGDAFLACDIAALNGPSDDVSYEIGRAHV